jgi:hypothetical protein
LRSVASTTIAQDDSGLVWAAATLGLALPNKS